MALFQKKVDPEDLNPGDHIYTYRMNGLYTHHGIYVGGGRVIDFTSTENKNGRSLFSSLSSSRSSVNPNTAPACPECGYRVNTGHGVVKTCLDCFRRENGRLQPIHYFTYDVPLWRLWLMEEGTCSSLSCNKSPEEVVKVAHECLSKGFGTYDLIFNNCEHFATYCKTGVRASRQGISSWL